MCMLNANFCNYECIGKFIVFTTCVCENVLLKNGNLVLLLVGTMLHPNDPTNSEDFLVTKSHYINQTINVCIWI